MELQWRCWVAGAGAGAWSLASSVDELVSIARLTAAAPPAPGGGSTSIELPNRKLYSDPIA